MVLATVTWCCALMLPTSQGTRELLGLPVLLSLFKLRCKKECGTSFSSAGRVLAIILRGRFLDTHSFV